MTVEVMALLIESAEVANRGYYFEKRNSFIFGYCGSCCTIEYHGVEQRGFL